MLTWCDAVTAARILRGLRGAGCDAAFVGGPQLVVADLADRAGGNPGEVLALYATTQSRREIERFTRDYESRFKRPCTDTAYLSYRAMRHLLAALEGAAPERDAVRRELGRMGRCPGADLHPPGGAGAGPIVETIIARLQADGWRFQTLSQR